ncbi:MAG: LysM peptidoglycan-binding domain-containing protein [Planctomycetes bacterium]|nr:LysM peptidoglycan-binding domain-containing protein [Planctomycetota bacterium]
MHRDKKLGLALGILLVGIVGALFFRNEPAPAPSAPALSDPATLDREIAQKRGGPYPDLLPPQFAGEEPAPGDSGFTAELPDWELPDFLKNDDGTSPVDRAGRAGAPDPLRPAGDDESFGAGTGAGRFTSGATPPGPPLVRGGTSASAAREGTGSVEALPTVPEMDGFVLHRVRAGETLSELAQKYLGTSARFLEIYEANHSVLESPDAVRAGMTLRIPTADPRDLETANEPGPSVNVRAAGPASELRLEHQISSTQDPFSSIAKPQSGQPSVETANAPDAEMKLRFRPVERSPLVPRRKTAAPTETR